MLRMVIKKHALGETFFFPPGQFQPTSQRSPIVQQLQPGRVKDLTCFPQDAWSQPTALFQAASRSEDSTIRPRHERVRRCWWLSIVPVIDRRETVCNNFLTDAIFYSLGLRETDGCGIARRRCWDTSGHTAIHATNVICPRTPVHVVRVPRKLDSSEPVSTDTTYSAITRNIFWAHE